MKRSILAAAVTLALAAPAAQAVVLYDASIGTSPVAQGLVYQDISFGGSPHYTVNAAGTTLDTTPPTAIFAGFGSNATSLDRAAGFTLRVDARVISGTTSNVDRAAFSLIALGSDAKGIEIGITPTDVFSQSASPLFNRAELATFDSTAAVTRYEVTIVGDTYRLLANGVQLLTGPVRDYSAFVPPFGVPDPYEVPNAIFLGDNTSSASGSTLITYVSVPEPATVGAIAGAGIAMLRRRRRDAM